MDEKRIKEVFSDEAFVKDLLGKETAEEVKASLNDKGVELSLDEISKIREGLVKKVDQGGELSVDDLEDVSGGGVVSAVIGIIGLAIAGAQLTHEATRGRW